MQEYTVGEAARASGVTVRTLHHYDQIGLLVPTGRTASGYRLYSDTDLTRLHHIRTYQALGFPLEEIAQLLDATDRDALAQLQAQRELVGARIDTLAQVRRVIDAMMEAMMNDVTLTPEEIFEVFGDDDPNARSAETRARWGETDSFAESKRRTSRYGVADWKVIKAEQEQIEAEFAELLSKDVPSGTPQAQQLAERHRLHIDRHYYPCSLEMHCGLADMYLADPRFADHYDARLPGLAVYVHDAIWSNALGGTDSS